MTIAVAWFFTFFPITISPGPANILLSSTAAQVGSRRTLPLLGGIFSVFALQIAVVGFGIGEILFRLPTLFTLFKMLGALYLFYLAYQFFRSAGGVNSADAKVGFREGVLLQLFNFKAMTVPLIMYTQFLDPATTTRAQIASLTIALFALILGSMLTWVIGGSLLQRLFQSELGMKWQGKIFGVLLAMVAVWILFR